MKGQLHQLDKLFTMCVVFFLVIVYILCILLSGVVGGKGKLQIIGKYVTIVMHFYYLICLRNLI